MSKKKLLIVDDEQDVRNSLKRNLKKWADSRNVEILEAETGREALSILEKNGDTALILSDQKMPELSGADFLIEASGKYTRIVSVVLTGHASTSDIPSFLKAGIFSYLEKPWNKKNLLETMDKALKEYQDRAVSIARDNLLRDELENASLFHKDFTKPKFPETDKLAFSYFSLPGGILSFSGDYLDILKVHDGKYLFLMGDVTGHGIKAANILNLLKSVIDAEFVDHFKNSSNFSPGKFLTRVNKTIFETLRDFPDTFMALCACIINEYTGEVAYSNAGQPPILVIRDNSVDELIQNQLVIGVDNDTEYGDRYARISKGDLVFLYTDGLFPIGKETNHLDMILFKDFLMEQKKNREIAKVIIEKIKKIEIFEDDITALAIVFHPENYISII